MTLIERVRAVLAAGTPGPWVVDPPQDAEKIGLAVNLAPMFVALWEAAEKWDASWEDLGKDDADIALEKALAALNAAATREVGE